MLTKEPSFASLLVKQSPAMHYGHGWRNWRFTLNAKHAGHARRFGTGSMDMTLAFFFNALLYEIHCISH